MSNCCVIINCKQQLIIDQQSKEKRCNNNFSIKLSKLAIVYIASRRVIEMRARVIVMLACEKRDLCTF